MKKNKQTTAEQAITFIEDMRKMRANIDEPTQLISLRVPANILRSLKKDAELKGKKYQSVIVQLMRDYLKQI